MASLLDWQSAGVKIKVELATSGDLVLTPNIYPLRLDPGGSQGAPIYWTPYVLNDAQSTTLFNFTTSNGVFSVSNKQQTISPWAGAISPSYPAIPGSYLALNCRARVMQTYDNRSARYPAIEVFRNNQWQYYAAPSQAVGQTDWENISVMGLQPVPVDALYWHVELNGGFLTGVSNAYYGMQYRDVVVNAYTNMTLPDPTWTDITCDVRSLDIRHGRERYTNRYEAAAFTVELNNKSGIYLYHTDHPLGLRPGRQVRVTATYNGVTYPIAFGTLDSIGQGYSIDGVVIAQFACRDMTTVLSNTITWAGGGDAIDSNRRITSIIDQAAYPRNKRLIDPGLSNWSFQTISSSQRSLRDEAGVTADSEGGSFFGDRSGNMVYKNRNWLTTDPLVNTVQADLVAMEHSGYGPMPNPDNVPTVANAPLICVNDLETDWSMDRVINSVTLAAAGGNAQNYQDAPSMKAHGPQTYSRLDFVNWLGTIPGPLTALDQRAADLMNNYTEPVLRVNRIGFNPGVQKRPDIAWPFILSIFLNWLVRVWYAQPNEGWGFSVCTHVQSIEHRITPKEWAVVLVVDVPIGFREFQFPDGPVGWDEGVWDVNVWDQEE